MPGPVRSALISGQAAAREAASGGDSFPRSLSFIDRPLLAKLTLARRLCETTARPQRAAAILGEWGGRRLRSLMIGRRWPRRCLRVSDDYPLDWVLMRSLMREHTHTRTRPNLPSAKVLSLLLRWRRLSVVKT